MDNKNNQDNKDTYKLLAAFGQLGWMMVVPITLSILFGNWLDNFFKLSPVFLLTGVVIGVIIAFRNLFTFIDKFGK